MYGNYGPQPAPRSGSGVLIIVLVIVGVVLVLGLGTCAGLFFFLRAKSSASVSGPVVVAAVDAAAPAAPGSTTTSTMTIDRPGYTLKYPSTWSVDTADKDYDPDSYFAIDASEEGCTIMFFFLKAKGDPATHVKAQVDSQKKRIMPEPVLTPFAQWGNYQGSGMEMKGKTKPLGDGVIRAFSHTEKDRMFDVVEFCFEDDMPAVSPGFKTIESSFALKTPPGKGAGR
jgi:hypothetical protein